MLIMRWAILVFALILIPLNAPVLEAATLQESGAQGVEGTVPSPAPTQAATITTPANGASFSTLPITVAGLCPKGLLVEIFKNNVFSGSVNCDNGSYSLQIDLFDGRNDLVAKVFDSLNQQGPDSNTVTVNFSESLPAGATRVILISQYSKRGAQPGDKLTWPLTISGGTPPYAISIDWGDRTSPDLMSRQAPGDFEGSHTYQQAGSFKVIVKATDANGVAAFLQLNGIGNGPIKQTAVAATSNSTPANSIPLWVFLAVGLPLVLVTFWLGTRHQLQTIRWRLMNGEPPIK